MPGRQVYVRDRGLRMGPAEVVHSPVIAWDGGSAGKPVWAHDAERALHLLPMGGCRHRALLYSPWERLPQPRSLPSRASGFMPYNSPAPLSSWMGRIRGGVASS